MTEKVKDGIAVMTHVWEEPNYEDGFSENNFHEMKNPCLLAHMNNPTDKEYKDLLKLEKQFNKLVDNVKLHIGFSFNGKEKRKEGLIAFT